MKKGIIFVVFLISVLTLAGCVKAPFGEPADNTKEVDLIKELQEIERQLAEAEDKDSVSGDIVVESSDEVEENIVDVEQDQIAVGKPTIDRLTLQRIVVQETELVKLNVETEDEDEDEITYLFSPPLDETGMWQTNYSDAGEYIVTIAATDGENTVEQSILLVVEKKNVPPIVQDVPAQFEIDEGDEINIKPTVRDPNNDDVTVTFGAPLGKDGRWVTDHTSAGEYNVRITANDGELETAVSVTLIVRNINVPPELSGLSEEIIVNEGETITIKPVVSDLDGDTVEVSISDPVGDSGVWKTSYTSNGQYVVTVAASDGKDTVSKEVRITVHDVNVPPKITRIGQG